MTYHNTPCLKKPKRNYICHNFVKFPETLITFGAKMAKILKLYEIEVHSFSTSPNLR